MQFCDLCYVDAQMSGFVGLGINVFPAYVYIIYVYSAVYVDHYEHSLKSNKPFESWPDSLSLSFWFFVVVAVWAN